jgi:LEA14-like dessication related protein
MTVAVRTDDDVKERQISIEPSPPVESVETNIIDARQPAIGLTSATLSIVFEIRNTNPDFEVPSPTIDYDVSVNGQDVLSARDALATVPANDATTTELEFIIEYADLGEAIVSAIQTGEFPIQLSGTVEAEGAETGFTETYQFGAGQQPN